MAPSKKSSSSHSSAQTKITATRKAIPDQTRKAIPDQTRKAIPDQRNTRQATPIRQNPGPSSSNNGPIAGRGAARPSYGGGAGSRDVRQDLQKAYRDNVVGRQVKPSVSTSTISAKEYKTKR